MRKFTEKKSPVRAGLVLADPEGHLSSTTAITDTDELIDLATRAGFLAGKTDDCDGLLKVLSITLEDRYEYVGLAISGFVDGGGSIGDLLREARRSNRDEKVRKLIGTLAKILYKTKKED
jgi:hypothetical protein